MKKVLVLAMAVSLLFGGMAWAGVSVPSGMKYMEDKTGNLKMVVPEKAPEFLFWLTHVMFSHKFPNGNIYLVAKTLNPDETIVVTSFVAYFAETDEIVILAFQVSYFLPEFFDGTNPEAFYTDLYINAEFDKSGKPGPEYVQVKKDPDWGAWKNKLSSQPI